MKIQYLQNNYNFSFRADEKLVEQIKEMHKQHKSVKEICAALNIAERKYSSIVDTHGILTERKKSKLKIAEIESKRDEFQELIDMGFSKQEICKKYGLENSMFYRLLKRLNINYNYQHHYNEIKFSNSVLQAAADSKECVKKIAENLGINVTTYHQKAKEAGIKTIFRDSIDKITSLDPVEVQKDLDTGMKRDDICKKYNITKTNLIIFIRKHDLRTPFKTSMKNIKQVTKEKLLERRKAGVMIKDICNEFKISLSTYRRLINKK